MQVNQTAAPQIRSDVTVVTPDNFAQYVDEKLGIKSAEPESLEDHAASELKELEAKKAAKEAEAKAEEDPTHDAPELPEEKKNGINERFKKLTAQKKAAEEAAAKAIAEAKAEAEKAAKEAQELREKYEPKKTEQDPEPQPHQFTDIAEYTKALKEWSADDALRKREAQERENAEKAAREKVVKTWQERQESFKASTADYADTINSSQVAVPKLIEEYIIESDVGPQILYYLAKNPDVAKEFADLTPAKSLVKFGKLEASLSTETAKPQVSTKIAEISKAPAPITPIKAGSSIGSNKVDDKGEFHGTYEEWKQLRRTGKIK